MAVSKTRMTELVRAFAAPDVDAALNDTPVLRAMRDGLGRNWLHLCCSVDIDEEAFTEDDWKATHPEWGRRHRDRHHAQEA